LKNFPETVVHDGFKFLPAQLLRGKVLFGANIGMHRNRKSLTRTHMAVRPQNGHRPQWEAEFFHAARICLRLA
jgi:hypothetical protein